MEIIYIMKKYLNKINNTNWIKDSKIVSYSNNTINNYGIKSEVFNNINIYNLKNQNKINKKSEIKKIKIIKI
jgi:hypothetical protein